jgi:GNAT superfamily N-acetyltransferase
MSSNFRKALPSEILQIWEILKLAIARRKEEGSNQWQDGYPNPDVVQNDIDKGVGYVLLQDDLIVGYCAILINDEPEYANIIGKWITNTDFVVFHRVAIAENYLGQGLAKKMFGYIEEIALNLNVKSIKVDTNFDNAAMLTIFEKLGYIYCGEVYFRGSPRRAFEKVLK